MKKLIVLFFLSFCLLSCASKKSNSDFGSSKSKIDNSTISYELATGNKYLELDTTTTAIFKFENIEPKTVSIFGKTIRIIKYQSDTNDEIEISLSPRADDLVDGELKIIVSYKIQGVFKNLNLSIPVKVK